MELNKQDYENLLKILEAATVTGLKSAQQLAVLGHKLETQIASYDKAAALPPPWELVPEAKGVL